MAWHNNKTNIVFILNYIVLSMTVFNQIIDYISEHCILNYNAARKSKGPLSHIPAM